MYTFRTIRRRMTHAAAGVGRAVAWAYAPRKRVTSCLMILIAVVFTIAFMSAVNSRLPREDKMEQKIAGMQAHIRFLETLYRERQEEVLKLQSKYGKNHSRARFKSIETVTYSPEMTSLLKNLTGTHAITGLQPKNPLLQSAFVFQLLPHLMNDARSLQPAYHMRGSRNFTDIVLGVPTVRRDKESYLLITLGHLLDGLTEADLDTTLIVVYVGETDLEYVLNIARQIETLYGKYVRSGVIEVISPPASYYPDLDALAPTLGDSQKRFRWRTKQNLDALFLMAYAQTKGTYYLMLEDDVICKKTYMQEIKEYTAAVSVSNPQWFFIEYCPIGGIGKLFRSSDLLHFITYVQLFYNNLPIDWLLESYLADRVCTIEKAAKTCKKNKLYIRPKYKTSLFQHIGLYSSLKGKIQKVKGSKFGTVPTFYSHKNPPLETLRTDIEEHGDHTLFRAYKGQTFFWGIKPKKGDVAEFWFAEPTQLRKYTFRSGNAEHVSDKFYNAVVEVLPVGHTNFTKVGTFDEFGMADGILKKSLGNLSAIRVRVERDSTYWVILSEIDLKVDEVSKFGNNSKTKSTLGSGIEGVIGEPQH